jgi:hypothetical protein
MKITFFSVVMSILWGSALMLIFAALRKKKNLTDICSVTGIVILYVFCAVRMLIPIELPWVIVIPNESIYNPLYRAVRYTLPGGFTIIQVRILFYAIGNNKGITDIARSFPRKERKLVILFGV